MAYEKQTWTTGEVITQEKLNHMEDGIANAGGFECSETVAELFNETITTAKPAEDAPSAQANLAYSESITADTLIVTFDGVEYTCPKQSPAERVSVYGDLTGDFSQTPFYIASSPQGNLIFTQNTGEYAVKAEATTIRIDSITPCFASAVKSIASDVEHSVFTFNIIPEGNGYRMDCTYAQLDNAIGEGDVVIAIANSDQAARLSIAGAYVGTMGIEHYQFAGFYEEEESLSSIGVVAYDISASGAITRKASTISLT